MSGRHGEAIVFVHGVGSTAAIWDAQLRAFADDYRCFAVELRGNGACRPDPNPASISRAGYAEDVLTVADAGGAPRFHFVGCSLGGVVGLELCARDPQRLLSLTLVSSFAAYPDAHNRAAAIVQNVRAAGSMAIFAEQRAGQLGMPPGPRRDETVEQMAWKSVESYVAATYATWTGDYRPMLSAIAVPALVVAGDRDPVVPQTLAQELATGIPGARLVVIPGAGHVANADEPERFNAELRSFLRNA